MVIAGPSSSPYEGGLFRLELFLPEGYPMEPPSASPLFRRKRLSPLTSCGRVRRPPPAPRALLLVSRFSAECDFSPSSIIPTRTSSAAFASTFSRTSGVLRFKLGACVCIRRTFLVFSSVSTTRFAERCFSRFKPSCRSRIPTIRSITRLLTCGNQTTGWLRRMLGCGHSDMLRNSVARWAARIFFKKKERNKI